MRTDAARPGAGRVAVAGANGGGVASGERFDAGSEPCSGQPSNHAIAVGSAVGTSSASHDGQSSDDVAAIDPPADHQQAESVAVIPAPDRKQAASIAVTPAADRDQVARVAVIVPAAGRGERLGPGAPKALRELGGTPLLVHAVRSLLAARTVDVVCVAAPPSEEGVAEVRALLSPLSAESGKDVRVTAGGETRQESVAKALAKLPADCTVVLVHDAARALTPVELIESVVAAVRSGHAAVIPVLPVADTIKSVDGDVVTATIDRSRLRAVQTPQGFSREVLEKAHAGAEIPATDDAGLVEALGLPVHTVPGHAEAFKVTTPFDLVVAEAVLDRIRRRA